MLTFFSLSIVMAWSDTSYMALYLTTKPCNSPLNDSSSGRPHLNFILVGSELSAITSVGGLLGAEGYTKNNENQNQSTAGTEVLTAGRMCMQSLQGDMNRKRVSV